LFRDGFLILNTILALFRDYKPLTFFGGVGALLILAAWAPMMAVIFEFAKTGTVKHILLAVMGVGIGLAGLLIGAAGVILHTIVRRFQEIEHTLQVRADEMNRESQSWPVK
jgi:hypothetical protein